MKYKKDFEKLDYKYLKCESCNRIFPKETFSHRYAHKDGTAKFCKTCDWINRHNGIPNVDEFSKKEIIATLDFLLFKKYDYVNDLADELNLTLVDTMHLIQAINVGNCKCDVRYNCDCCGKEGVKKINEYLIREFHYCSLDCYWKDKTNRVPHGEDSPYYNRISTKCTNCGKDIKIIPYNNALKNSYGDNHNFCSQECYWNYRSKYYIKDKTYMYGKTQTDEVREILKLATAKRCANHNQVNSKIQLKVNDMLDSLNIKYKREYTIKYYSIDNYLIDSGLMIEVMGDYWHSNPLKFNENKYGLNEKQMDGIHRDKIKYSYIKNHCSVEFLYLWETDINKRPEVCKKLIKEYIRNQGMLDNYHSFNWELDYNDELVLCDKIIIPYQDISVDEYRHLLKKKVE